MSSHRPVTIAPSPAGSGFSRPGGEAEAAEEAGADPIHGVDLASACDAGLPPAAGGIDAVCVNTLRMLAVDMVEVARSGHPGLPLGAAPMAWALWSRFLRHDPTWPQWPDRDRFVLSAGHGSALLYGLLHLFGYGLSLDELRRFRQLGSRTPGHPERGLTPGVEMTTGPLGQGLAHAVGMALAERMSASVFNDDCCEPVVDHRTFVLCSDGDLMEGVSAEASSLAGHLALGRLVVLWDDNRITIDGPTDLAFGEDVCGRFRAYGWDVGEVEDGNDVDAVSAAVSAALADEQRPSLIRVRTTIGYGAPNKAGTAAAHGAPLGAAEVAGLRREIGWTSAEFTVPDEVRARVTDLAHAATGERMNWDRRLASWATRHPELRAHWERRFGPPGRVSAPLRLSNETEANGAGSFDGVTFEPGTSVATRVAWGRVLAETGASMPEVVGGSADLTESTCTAVPGGPVRPGAYAGRHIHFGVREHAMAAMANGLALHGGFLPVVSTFMVFSDYARPALRLAALMGQQVVHAYTHDSIGLGEDGPTHQPVEQLAAMRAMPGVAVLRPADANEVVEAWGVALGRVGGPTVLALSRQALPVLPAGEPGWISSYGARVVHGSSGTPDVVIVATGSEVSKALEAAGLLDSEGTRASVVSMPWRERFLGIDRSKREQIVPDGVPVVVVEAGSAQGWEVLLRAGGALVCLDRFGASGPGEAVAEAMGSGAARIAEVVRQVVGTSTPAGGVGR